MIIIDNQKELNSFCNKASKQPFICIDTEFMRESTFFSILCLIQIATDETEVVIDPLAKDINLAPIINILLDSNITKVFHAARQDIEIFYNICGEVPKNIFDTQIAAMALGFRESIGYSSLVKGRLNINIDKGERFTDWSRRPLTKNQLKYALADVTHLRNLYPGIVRELTEKNRLSWIKEETSQLTDKKLYSFEPENAWERLKIRNPKISYLAALKAAAAWRERRAIEKNIPRRRVLKDEILYNIAQQKPKDLQSLMKLRGIPRGFEKSESTNELIKLINTAVANADIYAPDPPKVKHMPPNLGPTVEMLKTLLRLRTEYVGIAPKLVATSSDIVDIAAFGEKSKAKALTGWRKEIYGTEAIDMLNGKIGLCLEGREVVVRKIN